MFLFTLDRHQLELSGVFSYARYDLKFEFYEPMLVIIEYFLVFIVLIYELHSIRKLNPNLI